MLRNFSLPLTLAFALNVLGATGTLPAQDVDPRLSLEFHRRFQELRTGSPISIDWTLLWEGQGMPKGYLEVHVLQGQEKLGRLRTTTPAVLTSSGARFRTLLPTFTTNDPLSPLDIQAYFVSDLGTFDLGERSMRVAGAFRRSFVVAFCNPWQQTTSLDEVAFTATLDFSILIDPNDPLRRLIATYPARIFPEDLPDDPLWLCEYNLIVLLPEGFRDLRRPQMDALKRWVDAGGSLCVFLDEPISRVHAGYLNGLARSAGDRVTLDDNGRPRLDSGPVRVRKGLGRVVVHQSRPMSKAFRESPGWQSSVDFLWSRHQRRRDLPARGDSVRVVVRPRPGTPPPLPEIKSRIQTLGSLLARLTPDDFRVVPLWLLGTLLVGYVVVIGPVDYFLLGIFRRRKLTWIFFPLVTLGFTLLIVWTSHDYMGTTGDAKSVIFRDIGDDGTLVRENRFQLHLKGQHSTQETTVRRGLFTPIDHRRFLFSTNRIGSIPFGLSDLDLAKPAEYVGLIPGEFTAIQDLPQWSPQLNRIFRIGPAEKIPSFDWDSIQPEALSVPGKPQSQFIASVRTSFGERSGALLLHGEGPPRWIGESQITLFPSTTEWDDPRYHYRERPSNQGPGKPVVTEVATTSFLQDICVRPPVGVFATISQVGPHGGNNFEDLVMLDPTDPGQWLLVIARTKGHDLILYRHLYIDRPFDTDDPFPVARAVPQPNPPTPSISPRR
ncbi:MAG: hypothetical protein QF363_18195 [Planctomycetaceae bacterium]|nr:hypothetical protein [Planctomycetaceae bacterium]